MKKIRGEVVNYFLSKEDRRSENRELAFKMVFRELAKLGNKDVNKIIARWGIKECEVGKTLSLDIVFPNDVSRYQYFTDGIRFIKKK